MRRAGALALLIGPALLGGCGQSQTMREVDARIVADFARGEVQVTCRKSSSGTCYTLFLTDGMRDDGTVKQGETASAGGLGPDTRYCIGTVAPEPATCRPRPLTDGEQILRSSTIRTH